MCPSRVSRIGDGHAEACFVNVCDQVNITTDRSKLPVTVAVLADGITGWCGQPVSRPNCCVGQPDRAGLAYLFVGLDIHEGNTFVS